MVMATRWLGRVKVYCCCITPPHHLTASPFVGGAPPPPVDLVWMTRESSIWEEAKERLGAARVKALFEAEYGPGAQGLRPDDPLLTASMTRQAAAEVRMCVWGGGGGEGAWGGGARGLVELFVLA